MLRGHNGNMKELPLRERNKLRVRARILAAAFDLFKSVGYSQTTMDDIAARAEISRATIFNYFATKDSLLTSFVDDLFKVQILPAVHEYLQGQHSTVQMLRFLFMTIHEQVLTIPHIEQGFKQAFLQSREADPEALKQRNDFLDILTTILRYGQQRNEVRTDASLENMARYIGVLYVSIFYSMVMDLQPKPADYADEMNDLLTFVASGLTQGSLPTD
jgi:AcrR family transcriptional regulator